MAAPARGPGRLGVYLDDVYWVFEEDGADRISSDRSFLLFVWEVGDRFDSLVAFGRAVRAEQPADYVLPAGLALEALPHYSNLRHVPEVARAVAGTLKGFWRGLERVDRVWVFGPHPFALALALLALARGKQVMLGVRQDSVRLYEARLSSRWSLPLLAVRFLEAAYRLLSRRLLTTVQGAELAKRYGGERPGLLTMTESVVRASEVLDRAPERDWTGELQLLTVGRFETEKNPLLMVEALARIEAERPGRYRLTWVGRGPLEDDVRAHAERLGVLERIDFRSYVPFGDQLLALYRAAHMFVHVSFSEGMPKVLIEALVSGTPIVATDVGGVSAALDGGTAGLLVPPDDLEALVAAIYRLDDRADERDRLVERGLELGRALTLEAQVEGVVRFFVSRDRELEAAPARESARE
jgi:glycosyltransferase involved in cell wall biosynthesis